MAAEFKTVEVVKEESIRCAATFKNKVWIPDNTKVSATVPPPPKVKRELGKVKIDKKTIVNSTNLNV